MSITCGYFGLCNIETASGETHHLGTDEVDPQWQQVLRQLNVDVIYALSPQAKGKVERPYRWLQDRIVRTCALEKIIFFGRDPLRSPGGSPSL